MARGGQQSWGVCMLDLFSSFRKSVFDEGWSTHHMWQERTAQKCVVLLVEKLEKSVMLRSRYKNSVPDRMLRKEGSRDPTGFRRHTPVNYYSHESRRGMSRNCSKVSIDPLHLILPVVPKIIGLHPATLLKRNPGNTSPATMSFRKHFHVRARQHSDYGTGRIESFLSWTFTITCSGPTGYWFGSLSQ